MSKYKIFDSKNEKMLFSGDYNYIFNYKTGMFVRWGKTKEDDPKFSPIGPEIADIEITTICNGVRGKEKDGKRKLCDFCSPFGTLVNTPYGALPIETIKKHDFVLGYDLVGKVPKIQEVEESYERDYCGELVCIELDNGNVLKLTPDHIVVLKGGIEIIAGELIGDEELIFWD